LIVTAEFSGSFGYAEKPISGKGKVPYWLHMIEEGEKEMDLGFQGILPLYLSLLML
jgi:hypothetical protein